MNKMDVRGQSQNEKTASGSKKNNFMWQKDIFTSVKLQPKHKIPSEVIAIFPIKTPM